MAMFLGRIPPVHAMDTPRVNKFRCDFIPVTLASMVSPVSGNSGASGVAPMVNTTDNADYGVGWAPLGDTSIQVITMSGSGTFLTFPWQAPWNFDPTQNVGVQVIYYSAESGANLVGASGFEKFALTVRKESTAVLATVSGTGAVVSPSSNGTDFALDTWSGKTAVSGLYFPLISSLAEISGYVSGESASGTNFNKGDILNFHIEKQRAGATSGIISYVRGIRVWYQIDAL